MLLTSSTETLLHGTNYTLGVAIVKPQLWRSVNEQYFCNDPCFSWHSMDFPEKNPRIKLRLKNLWNMFFLIFDAFFCLILYHPGFYSSLSDKKQRNGSISKMFAILPSSAKTSKASASAEISFIISSSHPPNHISGKVTKLEILTTCPY